MTICPLPASEPKFCIWPMVPCIPEYDHRYKGRKPAVMPDGRQYGDSIHEVLAAFEGRPAFKVMLMRRTGRTSAQVGAALKNLRISGRVVILKPSRGSACAVYAPVGGEA